MSKNKDLIEIPSIATNDRDKAAMQARMIIAAKEFLRTGSKELAAQRIGVSIVTMRKYERDPIYIQAVNRYADAASGEVQPRLRWVLPKALRTLEGLLESDDENVRLKAAVQLFGVAERMKLNDPTVEDAKLAVAIVQRIMDKRPEWKTAFAEEMKAERELLDVELEEGEEE